MIAHKHITALVAILTAAAFLLSLCAVIFQDRLRELAGDTGITMDYETELFDTSEPMTVNILMDQDDWDTMLDNAASEEYYECDVEINGETFYHVGIRPKGNTSLTSIASDPDTDRFSLKLEFGHFVEGQTCHGLDKLILNNNYADATNMKEALIYDMYQYMGVDASLYNYASISVNGTYWGVYLALEAVEDSFMLRNYGTKNGDLYKPDSMNIGGAMDGADFDAEDIDFSSMDFGDMDFSSMDFGDMDFSDMDFSNMTPPDNADGSFDPSSFSGDLPEGFSFGQTADADAATEDSTVENGETAAEAADTGETAQTVPDTSEMPEMGDFDTSSFSFGGFSMGGSGANLNYTDDDLDSYSTIWEGAVTDSGKVDHQRVVKALKNVSEGTDLESTLDVDNILRYMAVHVFSVNDDSLTGAMAHNYYLYESDGQLNMIPWDYNLSFGGMGSSSDAGGVINDAIDDAFTGTNFFDTLMEDEEYHEEYYEYLLELVDGYINGGGFDAFYERVRSQIDTLVEEDPTAFYTYEEYLTAVEALYDVVKLRGESIKRQVDGSIASYASDRSDADDLVDASEIDLSVLGSMNTGNGNGGGGGFGGFGGMSFPGTDSDADAAVDSGQTDAAESDQSDDTAGADAADAADGGENAVGQTGEIPEGFDPSQTTDSSLPDDFDVSQFSGGDMPEGFDTSQFSGGSLPDDFDASQFSGGSLPDDFDTSQFSGGSLPDDFDTSQFSGSQSQDTTDAAENTEEDTEGTVNAPTDAAQPADAQPEEPEEADSAEEAADSAAEAVAEADESSAAEATDGEAAAELPEAPDGAGDFTMPDSGSSRSGLRVSSTTLLYYGISLAVLVIGFAVALLYRRRKRK